MRFVVMGYNLLVVLGHKLGPNNKIHEILVKRLNKAVVFYRDYSINNIIVSGGIFIKDLYYYLMIKKSFCNHCI